MDWLNQCHFGDVRAVLRQMAADGVKVNTIVTSPPYWGLRSYLPADHPDKPFEIGSEPTLREFLDTMVDVFDLCREVLRGDGTMWINMGDSYASKPNGPHGVPKEGSVSPHVAARTSHARRASQIPDGYKHKDLIGQPWRLAFALQDAGWWLRQDIVWHKPNPMPESIRDRCTKAHEYVFLLAKSAKYYYDFDAMQEPVSGTANARRAAGPSNGVGFGYADAAPKPRTIKKPDGWATHEGGHGSFHRDGREAGKTLPDPNVGRRVTKESAAEEGKGERMGRGPGWRKLAEAGSGIKLNDSYDAAIGSGELTTTRNRRSVWTIPSEPYSGAHFATFPRALVEPCILAGCPAGGTVLDIFFGSGTTGQVCQQLGRNFIGIDINRANDPLQRERLQQPGLMLESA